MLCAASEILRRDVYRGFGPTLAAEYLDRKHGMHAGRASRKSINGDSAAHASAIHLAR
jgi:hypothetical protein